jgi:hypothetical protein
VFCGFVVAWSLQASTIYDSTEQTTAGADPIENFGPLYDSFSTGGSSGQLSSLQLLLRTDNTLQGFFAVGLYGDSSSSPGALIANLGTVPDSSLTSEVSLLNIVLSADPSLSSDTRYWIGLSGITSGYWAYTQDTSGIGVNGEFSNNQFGTFSVNPNGAYQMEVGVSTSAAREPPTGLFSVSALSALAMLYGRRAKQLAQRPQNGGLEPPASSLCRIMPQSILSRAVGDWARRCPLADT